MNTGIAVEKKADLTGCNYWREIALLSVASKIEGKIIINRILTVKDKKN